MSVSVKTYPYGPLGANMYAVFSDTAFIVIDPCVEPSRIQTDLIPEAVFITHGHFDHIACVDMWKKKYPDVPVYIHGEDMVCLSSSRDNLSYDFGYPFTSSVEASNMDEAKGKSFCDGNLHFDFIHTPGHSKGSSCIVFTNSEDKFMFTGDMLFAGSVGRTDFCGSNTDSMKNSINTLKGISEDYLIYPGHGPSTTLQRELDSNPFFY